MIDLSGFNKNELFILKKIGIVFEGENVTIFKQAKKEKLLHTIPISEIDSILITKTNQRDYSILDLLNFRGDRLFRGIDSAPHAARLYALDFKMKNGETKSSLIKNFDLITCTRLLKRINDQLNEK